MKLFVATKLLVTGQLQDPQIASQAWSMITRSDDSALEALLPLVGGVEVITWVKDYYGIPFLGFPSPTKPTCWGNTQISALGIAYFYHQMKHDIRVAPWLVNALHHHEQYGADGTDQSFGIPLDRGRQLLQRHAGRGGDRDGQDPRAERSHRAAPWPASVELTAGGVRLPSSI